MCTSGSLPTAPSTWPTNRSARVRVGSSRVPTPMSPPGTANCRSLCSAYRELILESKGTHLTVPSGRRDTIPGRISISSPTLRTPWRMEPPATPPLRSFTSSPGLFTSKERITIIVGVTVKSRTGTGIFLAMYSAITSMLYLSCADTGMMGALSATVPLMKALMSSCCESALASLTRSILFCRMMMCLSFMISTAARCSEVWGCGQGSLPAMSSNAASMTAAPLSMVAMRMSCPGQSTNETCRTTSYSKRPILKRSSVDEPRAW
mmetsp:Transcript_520/g.1592  ORF Transcript_520/g.1592 Transcript_520/m.1592 type:complete len:264 (-) Transcript_520:323-1114(-)